MKIGEVASGNAAPVRRRQSAGTGDAGLFAGIMDAAEARESAAATAASDVASVNVLVLQEVQDEEIRRRRMIEHGRDMLFSLERLREGLLRGEVPASVLSELSQRLARQREMVSDPRLLALIDDIELRVAVEQAKLQKAMDAIKGLPDAAA